MSLERRKLRLQEELVPPDPMLRAQDLQRLSNERLLIVLHPHIISELILVE